MVKKVKIIELLRFPDARVNLSFIEQLNHIPFQIKRTYWIYDVLWGFNCTARLSSGYSPHWESI